MPQNKTADFFEIEWYETIKTTIRRKTRGGLEVGIRKKNRVPLNEGDLLWEDDNTFIQVLIKPCDCIVFTPKTMREMGIICFEIGNRHIPVYIDEHNAISVAFENPLYELLEKRGFEPQIIEKKLLSTHFFQAHEVSPKVDNLMI